MTDRDILAQIHQAEEYIVKAAVILHQVHQETDKRTEIPSDYPSNLRQVIRRDREACTTLFSQLFQMVEPWVLDCREELSWEGVQHPSFNGKSVDDRYPRGELSCFRYRYEILAGVRKAVPTGRFWDGTVDWRYPKVETHHGD
jgi:hypothetical protein